MLVFCFGWELLKIIFEFHYRFAVSVVLASLVAVCGQLQFRSLDNGSCLEGFWKWFLIFLIRGQIFENTGFGPWLFSDWSSYATFIQYLARYVFRRQRFCGSQLFVSLPHLLLFSHGICKKSYNFSCVSFWKKNFDSRRLVITNFVIKGFVGLSFSFHFLINYFLVMKV